MEPLGSGVGSRCSVGAGVGGGVDGGVSPVGGVNKVVVVEAVAICGKYSRYQGQNSVKEGTMLTTTVDSAVAPPPVASTQVILYVDWAVTVSGDEPITCPAPFAASPLFHAAPFLVMEQLVTSDEVQDTVVAPPDCTRAGSALIAAFGTCTVTLVCVVFEEFAGQVTA
jgi:hypothetical protein